MIVAAIMNKIKFSLCCNKKYFLDSLLTFQLICHRTKATRYSIFKRSSLLQDMITDRDKRKNWSLNINADKPKCRNVFDKLHKPSRRQSVLNSLFIKNITDVISTGEIAPEVLGYGIEITGDQHDFPAKDVKISPCCRILNVFWQILERYYDSAEDISKILNIAAPKIRAELISRNVMGRVPIIFFLRDGTNAKIAAFEQALKQVDLPSNTEFAIIPDDTFTKNIYSFKKPKVKEEDDMFTKIEDVKAAVGIPSNPPDMKSDIFGLNHDVLMKKVLASKSKAKSIQQSAVISPDMMEEDLFSKIPGICFQTDTTRNEILKKFQVERKMLMKKKTDFRVSKVDYEIHEEENSEDYVPEDNSFLEDFVEEDTKDDSRL